MDVVAPYHRRFHVPSHIFTPFLWLLINFEFGYLVAITIVFPTINLNIAGFTRVEADDIVTSVAGAFLLHSAPGIAVIRDLNIVLPGVFLAPFDDHFGDCLTLPEIDSQPMRAVAVFPPVSAGVAVYRLGSGVATAFVTRGTG